MLSTTFGNLSSHQLWIWIVKKFDSAQFETMVLKFHKYLKRKSEAESEIHISLIDNISKTLFDV